MPVRVAVPLWRGRNVMPWGSLLDLASRAAGKPRVTIVNVLCLPARKVMWSGEVKAGRWWTVSVNACVAGCRGRVPCWRHCSMKKGMPVPGCAASTDVIDLPALLDTPALDLARLPSALDPTGVHQNHWRL